MNSSDFPEIISEIKDVKKKNLNSINKKAHTNKDIISKTEEILRKCGETSALKVFTVDMRCEKLPIIPNLKEFRHLRILDVSSNSIVKVENIQHLNELKELKLFDNRLTSLSGLTGLKELIVLQVQYNFIEKLGASSLTTLQKLKQLRIDNNRLEEVTLRDLSSCSSLTYLDVSFNKLASISFITCLPNLEEFYATNNQIEAIPDLSRCKKLSELRVSNNVIHNVCGLKDHPSLLILDLSGNKIVSVAGLGCIEHLEVLNISRNEINDALLETVVSIFPNLEILNIAENNLAHLDQTLNTLGALTELCELVLRGNKFPVIGEETQEQYVHTVISDKLVNLRLLDDVSLKRADYSTKHGQSTLPMRPMTASAGVSLRQIENQLHGYTADMVDLQSKTDASYKAVLHSLTEVPENIKIDLTSITECPDKVSSLKSFRASRLKEALLYATKNYPEDVT